MNTVETSSAQFYWLFPLSGAPKRTICPISLSLHGVLTLALAKRQAETKQSLCDPPTLLLSHSQQEAISWNSCMTLWWSLPEGRCGAEPLPGNTGHGHEQKKPPFALSNWHIKINLLSQHNLAFFATQKFVPGVGWLFNKSLQYRAVAWQLTAKGWGNCSYIRWLSLLGSGTHLLTLSLW